MFIDKPGEIQVQTEPGKDEFRDLTQKEINNYGVGCGFRYKCHVNNTKITFVHVVRTAGISITDWFIKRAHAQKDSKSLHLTAVHENLRGTRKLFNDDIGISFQVIRNPWDWHVSCYHYHLRRFKNEKEFDLQDAKKKIPFETFLAAQRFGGYSQNPYNDKQTTPLRDTSLFRWATAFTVRFENLADDFNNVIKNIVGDPSDIPLQRKNTSDSMKTKGLDYTDYYNAETKDIVYHRHKTYIERYGYEFEKH